MFSLSRRIGYALQGCSAPRWAHPCYLLHGSQRLNSKSSRLSYVKRLAIAVLCANSSAAFTAFWKLAGFFRQILSTGGAYGVCQQSCPPRIVKYVIGQNRLRNRIKDLYVIMYLRPMQQCRSCMSYDVWRGKAASGLVAK